jgi:hypothetical protein
MLKESKIKKTIAVLLATTFLLTNNVQLPAYAQENTTPLPIKNQLSQDVTAISIPESIGEIQEYYRGSQDKFMVLIQDAHSIPDAQNHIRALIDFFQKKYGVSLTLAEGASHAYDARIFKSFPDQNLLKEKFKQYMTEGEVTGAVAASIFNESEASYEGVEDWEIYEEGIRFYLEALEHEQKIQQILEPIEVSLQNQKKGTYSKDLLIADKSISDFRENNKTLLEMLQTLENFKKPDTGSKISTLLSKMQSEKANTISLDIEVKSLAQRIKGVLNEKNGKYDVRSDLQEFNRLNQEYALSHISAEAFGLHLKKIISKYRIPIEVSKALSQSVESEKRLRDIKGTELFREIEEYMNTTKQSLIRNESEASLNRENEQFYLLQQLSALELTQENWMRVKAESKDIAAWPLRQDGIFESNRYEQLMKELEAHIRFYEIAELRDQILLKKSLQKMDDRKETEALLITGGFHAEGLTASLKKKGISYLLVIPKINELPQEIHYEQHMKGEVPWSSYFKVENGRVSLYDAFVRGTRDALLSMSKETQGVVIKKWRDQMIRNLAEEGNIVQARKYLKLLDEVIEDSNDESNALANEWLDHIDQFVKRLRGLEAQGQYNQQNILNLIQTSHAAVVAHAGAASRADSVKTDILRSVLGPEFRSSEDSVDESVRENDVIPFKTAYELADPLNQKVRSELRSLKVRNLEDAVTDARRLFSEIGIPSKTTGQRITFQLTDRGLIDNENLSPQQIEALKDWHHESFGYGFGGDDPNSAKDIMMPDFESFVKQTYLHLSLWPQQNQMGELQYLMGKGAGVELAIQGHVKDRQKRESFDTIRTHSDFELYGTTFTEESNDPSSNLVGSPKVPEAYKEVFGHLEVFPVNAVKAFYNLPTDPNDIDHIHRNHEIVDFGGLEILVPKLELLFLDKYFKREMVTDEIAHPDGLDALRLARSYDLDTDLILHYFDRFYAQERKDDYLEGTGDQNPKLNDSSYLQSTWQSVLTSNNLKGKVVLSKGSPKYKKIIRDLGKIVFGIPDGKKGDFYDNKSEYNTLRRDLESIADFLLRQDDRWTKEAQKIFDTYRNRFEAEDTEKEKKIRLQIEQSRSDLITFLIEASGARSENREVKTTVVIPVKSDNPDKANEDRFIDGPINSFSVVATRQTFEGHLSAVFDGHGGSEVAQMAQDHFQIIFQDTLIRLAETAQPVNYEQVLKESVEALHHLIAEELLAEGKTNVGATMTAIYFPKGENAFYSAILGDSPLLLIDQRGDQIEQLLKKYNSETLQAEVVDKRSWSESPSHNIRYDPDEFERVGSRIREMVEDEEAKENLNDDLKERLKKTRTMIKKLEDEEGEITRYRENLIFAENFVSSNGSYFENPFDRSANGLQMSRSLGDISLKRIVNGKVIDSVSTATPVITRHDLSKFKGPVHVVLATDGILGSTHVFMKRIYKVGVLVSYLRLLGNVEQSFFERFITKIPTDDATLIYFKVGEAEEGVDDVNFEDLATSDLFEFVKKTQEQLESIYLMDYTPQSVLDKFSEILKKLKQIEGILKSRIEETKEIAQFILITQLRLEAAALLPSITLQDLSEALEKGPKSRMVETQDLGGGLSAADWIGPSIPQQAKIAEIQASVKANTSNELILHELQMRVSDIHAVMNKFEMLRDLREITNPTQSQMKQSRYDVATLERFDLESRIIDDAKESIAIALENIRKAKEAALLAEKAAKIAEREKIEKRAWFEAHPEEHEKIITELFKNAIGSLERVPLTLQQILDGVNYFLSQDVERDDTVQEDSPESYILGEIMQKSDDPLSLVWIFRNETDDKKLFESFRDAVILEVESRRSELRAEEKIRRKDYEINFDSLDKDIEKMTLDGGDILTVGQSRDGRIYDVNLQGGRRLLIVYNLKTDEPISIAISQRGFKSNLRVIGDDFKEIANTKTPTRLAKIIARLKKVSSESLITDRQVDIGGNQNNFSELNLLRPIAYDGDKRMEQLISRNAVIQRLFQEAETMSVDVQFNRETGNIFSVTAFSGEKIEELILINPHESETRGEEILAHETAHRLWDNLDNSRKQIWKDFVQANNNYRALRRQFSETAYSTLAGKDTYDDELLAYTMGALASSSDWRLQSPAGSLEFDQDVFAVLGEIYPAFKGFSDDLRKLLERKRQSGLQSLADHSYQHASTLVTKVRRQVDTPTGQGEQNTGFGSGTDSAQQDLQDELQEMFDQMRREKEEMERAFNQQSAANRTSIAQMQEETALMWQRAQLKLERKKKITTLLEKRLPAFEFLGELAAIEKEHSSALEQLETSKSKVSTATTTASRVGSEEDQTVALLSAMVEARNTGDVLVALKVAKAIADVHVLSNIAGLDFSTYRPSLPKRIWNDLITIFRVSPGIKKAIDNAPDVAEEPRVKTLENPKHEVLKGLLNDWEIRPDVLDVLNHVENLGITQDDILAIDPNTPTDFTSAENGTGMQGVLQETQAMMESGFLYHILAALFKLLLGDDKSKILFLGRDGDNFLDASRLAARLLNNGLEDRLQLFPASTSFWTDLQDRLSQAEEQEKVKIKNELKEYFAGFGITAATIADENQRFYLVDSGVRGTIAIYVTEIMSILYAEDFPDLNVYQLNQKIEETFPTRLVSMRAKPSEQIQPLFQEEDFGKDQDPTALVEILSNKFPITLALMKNINVTRIGVTAGKAGIDYLWTIWSQRMPRWHSDYRVIRQNAQGKLIGTAAKQIDTVYSVDSIAQNQANPSIVNPIGVLIIMAQMIEQMRKDLSGFQVDGTLEDSIEALQTFADQKISQMTSPRSELRSEESENVLTAKNKTDLDLRLKGYEADWAGVLRGLIGFTNAADDAIHIMQENPTSENRDALEIAIANLQRVRKDYFEISKLFSDFINSNAELIKQGSSNNRVDAYLKDIQGSDDANVRALYGRIAVFDRENKDYFLEILEELIVGGREVKPEDPRIRAIIQGVDLKDNDGDMLILKFPIEIGKRFNAHGMWHQATYGHAVRNLINILDNGLDPKRSINEMPLNSGGRGSGYGAMNPMDSSNGITIVSPIDGSLAEDGVAYVLLDTMYENVIENFREMFPHIQFILAKDAVQTLTDIVEAHDRSELRLADDAEILQKIESFHRFMNEHNPNGTILMNAENMSETVIREAIESNKTIVLDVQSGIRAGIEKSWERYPTTLKRPDLKDRYAISKENTTTLNDDYMNYILDHIMHFSGLLQKVINSGENAYPEQASLDEPLSFVVRELIKNAVYHGNGLNVRLPVAIQLGLEKGRLTKLSVFDFAENKSPKRFPHSEKYLSGVGAFKTMLLNRTKSQWSLEGDESVDKKIPVLTPQEGIGQVSIKRPFFHPTVEAEKRSEMRSQDDQSIQERINAFNAFLSQDNPKGLYVVSADTVNQEELNQAVKDGKTIVVNVQQGVESNLNQSNRYAGQFINPEVSQPFELSNQDSSLNDKSMTLILGYLTQLSDKLQKGIQQFEDLYPGVTSDTRGIDFAILEFLKNAVYHGNQLDIRLPVAIKFDFDENRLTGIHSFDLAEKQSSKERFPHSKTTLSGERNFKGMLITPKESHWYFKRSTKHPLVIPVENPIEGIGQVSVFRPKYHPIHETEKYQTLPDSVKNDYAKRLEILPRETAPIASLQPKPLPSPSATAVTVSTKQADRTTFEMIVDILIAFAAPALGTFIFSQFGPIDDYVLTQYVIGFSYFVGAMFGLLLRSLQKGKWTTLKRPTLMDSFVDAVIMMAIVSLALSGIGLVYFSLAGLSSFILVWLGVASYEVYKKITKQESSVKRARSTVYLSDHHLNPKQAVFFTAFLVFGIDMVSKLIALFTDNVIFNWAGDIGPEKVQAAQTIFVAMLFYGLFYRIHIGFVLAMAGVLGNFYDQYHMEGVIDFLPALNAHPNIADWFLATGVGLIFLDTLVAIKEGKSLKEYIFRSAQPNFVKEYLKLNLSNFFMVATLSAILLSPYFAERYIHISRIEGTPAVVLFNLTEEKLSQTNLEKLLNHIEGYRKMTENIPNEELIPEVRRQYQRYLSEPEVTREFMRLFSKEYRSIASVKTFESHLGHAEKAFNYLDDGDFFSFWQKGADYSLMISEVVLAHTLKRWESDGVLASDIDKLRSRELTKADLNDIQYTLQQAKVTSEMPLNNQLDAFIALALARSKNNEDFHAIVKILEPHVRNELRAANSNEELQKIFDQAKVVGTRTLKNKAGKTMEAQVIHFDDLSKLTLKQKEILAKELAHLSTQIATTKANLEMPQGYSEKENWLDFFDYYEDAEIFDDGSEEMAFFIIVKSQDAKGFSIHGFRKFWVLPKSQAEMSFIGTITKAGYGAGIFLNDAVFKYLKEERNIKIARWHATSRGDNFTRNYIAKKMGITMDDVPRLLGGEYYTLDLSNINFDQRNELRTHESVDVEQLWKDVYAGVKIFLESGELVAYQIKIGSIDEEIEVRWKDETSASDETNYFSISLATDYLGEKRIEFHRDIERTLMGRIGESMTLTIGDRWSRFQAGDTSKDRVVGKLSSNQSIQENSILDFNTDFKTTKIQIVSNKSYSYFDRFGAKTPDFIEFVPAPRSEMRTNPQDQPEINYSKNLSPKEFLDVFKPVALEAVRFALNEDSLTERDVDLNQLKVLGRGVFNGDSFRATREISVNVKGQDKIFWVTFHEKFWNSKMIPLLNGSFKREADVTNKAYDGGVGVARAKVIDVEGGQSFLIRSHAIGKLLLVNDEVNPLTNEIVMERIGKAMATMHNLGIAHGDVFWGDINWRHIYLVIDETGNARIAFLDFDRGFVGDPLAPETIGKIEVEESFAQSLLNPLRNPNLIFRRGSLFNLSEDLSPKERNERVKQILLNSWKWFDRGYKSIRNELRTEPAEQSRSEMRTAETIMPSPGTLSFEKALSYATRILPDGFMSKLKGLVTFTRADDLEMSVWVSESSIEKVENTLVTTVMRALQESLGSRDAESTAGILWTDQALEVKNIEVQLLLQQLAQYQNRARSIALALPEDQEIIEGSPALVQLLEALKQHKGQVNEMILNGKLPASYLARLQAEGGVDFVRATKMNRTVMTMNDQSSIPLIVLGKIQSTINKLFAPFRNEISNDIAKDPMTIDYVELLRVVAAIHYADIVSSKDFSADLSGEALKAELLSRLQRFGDSFEQILQKEGNGWTIKASVAKAYLEMRIAEAMAASA